MLEGAEDFDVINEATAITIQVKHTRKKLTLRAPIVVDALAGFLDTVRRNPLHQVRYRLLTTAVITIEKGSPFGKGTAGLALWESTQRTGDKKAARAIATFLSKGSIPAVLRTFLMRESDTSVVDLIQAVSWDTGSRDLNFVEQAVTDHVITYGYTSGIAPSASKKVVGQLLRKTLRVATTPSSPPLTRARFLDVFEQATSEQVPRPELEQMRRAVALTSALGIGAVPSGITIQSIERVYKGVPPLAFDPLPRQGLRNDLIEILRRQGSLVLLGATGTGKTILAKQIALQSRDNVIWTSFVGCDEDYLPVLLRDLRIAKLGTVGQGIVILDDLDLRSQRQS